MAKKSQASRSLSRTREKKWERLWAISGRAERIEARVELGKEALKLDNHIGRRQLLAFLTSITGDRARSHRVLRVAQMRKTVINYATREAGKGNCMSWTHLGDLASIAKRENHNEIARRCVNDHLSVAKLRQILAEEYAYVPGQGRIRVTELSTAIERQLRRLAETKTQVLADDQGKSFIEATKQVKPHHRDAAISGLDDGLKLLDHLKSETEALEQCLTKARERLKKFREEDAKLQ